MKVGRNDICPCGSGKKFKKCHLGLPPHLWIPASARPNPTRPSPLPNHVRQQFEQKYQQDRQRVATFGNIRPIIHMRHHDGTHLVGVRNRIYYSKDWNFFTDFLFEYGFTRFGNDWVERQKKLDTADQHPMFIWRRQAYDYMSSRQRLPDGGFAGSPNGPMAASNNFYYDLYTVDDNTILEHEFVERLRNKD